ncbi:polyisoprenoid-binding protein YceI [Mycolicibacterium iranicum]|uniref:Polyisoprenoid-binding protein YceI n=1 Tax=Mycolicibacterium iranicum TaxID=912594 RepID=A0A839Q1Y5_MYCIR|nr:YceI family protein [Mycolicibacterium iranicum]MBB2989717.1 polyisoprenoid-binding protein YceI [Mycolicibacterium iranicum]
MADTEWDMDSSDGELLVETGVEGPAAKMGHRLTLSVPWRAAVRWRSGQPVAVELIADTGALEVLRGDGGVTGLSGPEKVLARSNALKSLNAKRFPRIVFRTDDVDHVEGGYRLGGTLEIHGTVRERVVDLRVQDLGELWRMSCDAPVRQSDFGVKPYSMMLGAMRVADEVHVSFTAQRAKDL